ncbi:hypothetical protein VAEU17_4360090 [Vibrio aestuarianus]|nr:hypothetical protein VAEU17_4360090 [Vibrio aestuarianus]
MIMLPPFYSDQKLFLTELERFSANLIDDFYYYFLTMSNENDTSRKLLRFYNRSEGYFLKDL